MLVDIILHERGRGQGLAPALLEHTEGEFTRLGLLRLHSWTWRTNHASIRLRGR